MGICGKNFLLKDNAHHLDVRFSPLSSDYMTVQTQTVLSAILFATGLWLSLILMLRYILKALLSYHAWIFESHGKISFCTKLWLVCLLNVSISKST